MAKPLLLIVDGESLKSPDLSSTLEREGWEIRWATREEARHFLDWGMSPDLMVLDARTAVSGGFELVRRYRERRPDLPVVLVRDGNAMPTVPVSVQDAFDRSTNVETMVQHMNAFRPKRSGKLAPGADLFADLLADLEEVPGKLVAAPSAVQAAVPDSPYKTVPATKLADLVGTSLTAEPWTPEQGRQVPAPLPAEIKTDSGVKDPGLPPPPQRQLETEDIFGDMLADLEGQPKPAAKKTTPPPPSPPPPPPVVPVAVPAASLPAPPPEVVVSAPLEKNTDEYTLSGISGIHDPFDLSSGSVANLEFGTPTNSQVTPVLKSTMPKPAAGPAMKFPEIEAEGTPDGALEEFGNYYLLEKVAVGGMAELFKAKQRGVHNFQKIVAIKRILPHLSDNDEFVTMFIDEAKLAAQLTHPNIVQIFDLGKASNAYYIAMEFVDGRDLRSLLRKVREYRIPVPENIAAAVVMKVAGALDYAHRKKGLNDKELKLVHRDISPQNILISYEGAVKLVDFGIAKAATKNTQTMAGALKGKLLYMSPEQALGQSLDSRSDIYSLGLVLFELLTGERCFQADSELGVLEKVRMGRIADIQSVNPMVSREMATALGKALQKNVDQRYSSARLLERDLKELVSKRGNEPTDHDIAEYVNVVLKGTKEQVEELLAARFSVKPPPPKGATVTAVKAPPPPKPQEELTAMTPAARRPQPPPPLAAYAPQMEIEQGPRRWLGPAIVGLAALIALLLWLASTLNKP